MSSKKKIEANRRNAEKSTGPRTEEGKVTASKNATKHGIFAAVEVLPHLEREEEWEAHRARVIQDLRPVGYMEQVLADRVTILLWRMGRVVRFEREVSAAELENVEWQRQRDFVREARERVLFLGRFPGMSFFDTVPSKLAAWIIDQAAEDVDVEIYGHATPISFPGYPDGADLDQVHWTVENLRDCLKVIARHAGLTMDELLTRVEQRAHRQLKEDQDVWDGLQRELDQRRRRSLLPPGPELDKVTRYEAALERSLFRTLHELQCLQGRRGADLEPPLEVDADAAVALLEARYAAERERAGA